MAGRVETPKAARTLNYGPSPLNDREGEQFYTRQGLSPRTVNANAAFNACVDLLSHSIAMATWKLTNTADNPASKALHDFVEARYWYWVIFGQALFSSGNGFMVRDNNDELLPCLWGVAKRDNYNRELRYDVYTIREDYYVNVHPSRVFAVHLAGYNGLMSPSPIVKAAADALAMYNSAVQTMDTNMRSGVYGRTALEVDPELAGYTPEQRAELTELIRDGFSEITRHNLVPVLPPGISATQLGGASAVDLQIVELLKWTVEDLCRIHHVPPRQVGHYPAAAPRAQKFEDVMADYVRTAVRPKCKLIANEMKHQMLPRSIRADLDPSAEALGTFSDRVNAIDQAVAKAGTVTIDEGRMILEGRLPAFPPRPNGEGDRLLSPTGAPDQREGQAGNSREPDGDEPDDDNEEPDDES